MTIRKMNDEGNNNSIVAVFDFGGIAINSDRCCERTTIDILLKYARKYGLTGQKARKLTFQIMYYGGDIIELIKMAIPEMTILEINEAMKEYWSRAKEEIYKPSIINQQFCKMINEARKEHIFYISSLADEELISWCLKEKCSSVIPKIKKIYGNQSGPKREHFKEIREQNPEKLIIFITDNVYDAKEDADIILGIVKDNDSVKRVNNFHKYGTNNEKKCFVVHRLFDARSILKGWNIL